MFNQEMFDKMPAYPDSGWWFIPENGDWVHAMQKQEDGSYDIFATKLLEDDNIITEYESIGEAWQIYKNRPEFSCMRCTAENTLDEYEIKFVGAMMIRAFREGKNPDKAWKRINRCLEWLRTTDFYTCPASTQYHDSYPAGLLNHSLQVADRAVQLLESSAFNHKVHLEDAIFVALVHDWCKIGLYEPYMRNVKNEHTGQWEQKQSYRYKEERAICLGHGASSMYLVMKFFDIDIKVAAAIRHHMNVWNCPEPECNELQQANKKYPLVHLIQFADQLSITDY